MMSLETDEGLLDDKPLGTTYDVVLGVKLGVNDGNALEAKDITEPSINDGKARGSNNGKNWYGTLYG